MGSIALLLLAGLTTLYALQYRAPQDGRTWDESVPAAVADRLDWRAVGGDPANAKFSPLAQIAPNNVGRLEIAWTYRTGDAAAHPDLLKLSKFEATPIIAGDRLVFCTPFNRAIAVDPATGKQLWSFDARIDTRLTPAGDFNCRGLAQWSDPGATVGAACTQRVFMATNDRRLWALDAATGKPCAGFGTAGVVTAIADSETHEPTEVQIVAAPAVIGDVVIVGSSVSDNERADAASGRVHAFDAQTGKPRWTFDPIPEPHAHTGAGNVWSSISGDPQRDLVFLPTSSPSPDFYGGGRDADERLTNAVVALRASTGKRVWAFQTVHHDLWDYDTPSAPSLFTLHRDGRDVPALAFATKQGFLYVLNRETGAPLFRVTERPVPRSDVPGEAAAPTQPFSSLPALAPQRFSDRDVFGLIGLDARGCRKRIAGARNDGLFTPPSLRGAVYAPATTGGANWGGVAIDPVRNRLVVNTNALIEVIRLQPQGDVSGATGTRHTGLVRQLGTPYAAWRGPMVSRLGIPCNRPPWGLLAAIDLDTGALAWRSTLGTTAGLAPLGISLKWGTPNVGGPMVTGSGLVFIGATMDNRLRAFDIRSGEELWAAALPAGAQASPMSYAIGGRQFVVIAAGGNSVIGTRSGDYLMAFALPMRR